MSEKLFLWIKSNVSSFSFVACTLGLMLKNLSPEQGHGFNPVCSSSLFIGLAMMLELDPLHVKIYLGAEAEVQIYRLPMDKSCPSISF